MGLGVGTREALSKAEIENLPTIRGGGLGCGGLKLAKWGWQGAECIAILPLIMTKKPKLP